MQIFISGAVYNTTTHTIEQIENQVNAYISRVGYYNPVTFKMEIISDSEILLCYNRSITKVHYDDMISHRDANLVCGISDTFTLPQMWGVFAPCDSCYMERSFLAKSYKYNSRILCPENRIAEVNISATTEEVTLRITY